jgi:hypothetical protein
MGRIAGTANVSNEARSETTAQEAPPYPPISCETVRL